MPADRPIINFASYNIHVWFLSSSDNLSYTIYRSIYNYLEYCLWNISSQTGLVSGIQEYD